MRTDNRFKRLWQHWILPSWRIKKQFPKSLLKRLEQGIEQSEAQHLGQIRFVIESNMPTSAVLSGMDPRERARYYFSHLDVWDTAYNTGVLLYIGCADRALEIVADRGINAKVAPDVWQAICQQLAQAFKQQQYEQGLEHALNEISAVLISHVPRLAQHHETDNLSNEIVLR